MREEGVAFCLLLEFNGMGNHLGRKEKLFVLLVSSDSSFYLDLLIDFCASWRAFLILFGFEVYGMPELRLDFLASHGRILLPFRNFSLFVKSVNNTTFADWSICLFHVLLIRLSKRLLLSSFSYCRGQPIVAW